MPLSHSPHSPLRVLFVVSEIHPLIKTGGLADVAEALPAALKQQGIDVRVLVPGYAALYPHPSPPPERGRGHGSLNSLEKQKVISLSPYPEATLLSGCLSESGIPLYILDCPALYGRPGNPYLDPQGKDWVDNHVRFGLLARVAALMGHPEHKMGWRPDVIHCNDWQTGLTPLYLQYQPEPRPASIITIHNLAYQGIFPLSVLPALGLTMDALTGAGLEYYGNASFLKAGIYFADAITTVSPTYAREIQHEPLGFGMHGLLAHRKQALQGILNGINDNLWNPATDPFIKYHYSVTDINEKRHNKQALQKETGLEINPNLPLLAIISRMAYQKGLDILLTVIDDILRLPAQLIVLGNGDRELEIAFTTRAQRHLDKMAVYTGFDEAIGHRIEASADIFLMPSRYEPCGLNQMYSQRYGTIPVAHATGGLADTVIDCTPQTLANHTASGFTFQPLESATLLTAIKRAAAVYHDKAVWRQLQLNGMTKDFSWQKSAKEYVKIYEKLTVKPFSLTPTPLPKGEGL